MTAKCQPPLSSETGKSQSSRPSARIIVGDALTELQKLPSASVDCCVTSPPYWGLRDYGVEGQLGLEPTLSDHISALIAVMREMRRVLKPEGTLWLNLGDRYAKGYGSPEVRSVDGITRRLQPKDLVGLPWRLAFALQADGWVLRTDIVWHKPNVVPESMRDRPTRAHEFVFLFATRRYYYYDYDAILEPSIGRDPRFRPINRRGIRPGRIERPRNRKLGEQHAPHLRRNRRTVWTIPPRPYGKFHFATFPERLVEPCILAGCPVGGVVLDPFAGTGTTLVTALRNGRNSIGIELNPSYTAAAQQRIADSGFSSF